MTKSFVGTLAAMLIAEGKIDPAARASRYVPELASSAFGDATVGQVLDMTTALDFVENYTGDSITMAQYRYATGFSPRPAEYTGPASIYSYLPSVKKRERMGRNSTTARRTST